MPTEGRKPTDFLRNQLDVPAPYLLWDLFRHSLMHGEYPRCGEYESKQIRWHIVIDGQGHNVTSGYIKVDAASLHKSLCQFLNDEIKKDDPTIIEVEEALVYSSNSSKQVIDEFSMF